MSSSLEASERDQKVIDEFLYLSERSQQLFHGLRDLPQYGQKQWQPYFGRTFEIYTRLWKFQQQHRQLLESKGVLSRPDVGEIASKIGQLYYHYYLRTSETNYLYESYIFYEAIRSRKYFISAPETEKTELVVKRLRYYARYIVVCLLLQKRTTLSELCQEFEAQVQDYIRKHAPSDSNEWLNVIKEIHAFLDAENVVTVNAGDSKSASLSLTYRRQGGFGEGQMGGVGGGVGGGGGGSGGKLSVQLTEAIVVDFSQSKVKFSELTLDMFRFLQTLEREPEISSASSSSAGSNLVAGAASSAPPTSEAASDAKADASTTTTPATNTTHPSSDGASSGKRSNPHKYLLFRPTLQQLMCYASISEKEISSKLALLLYISGDILSGALVPDGKVGIPLGGFKPALKAGAEGDVCKYHAEFLYPEDLFPLTRKPLFLVLDCSFAALSFGGFKSPFQSPFVCLMSALETPKGFKDSSLEGNLLTLFLYSPLVAIASITGIADIPESVYRKGVTQIGGLEEAIYRLMVEDSSTPFDFLFFLSEDFLSRFIVRFVITKFVFLLHKTLKEKPQFQPGSVPALPSFLFSNPDLLGKFLELFATLDVALQFATNFDAPLLLNPSSAPLAASLVDASLAAPSVSVGGGGGGLSPASVVSSHGGDVSGGDALVGRDSSG